MDNDFVDVFPSAGGVGDSPVKTTASEGHLNQGSSSRPGLSLSIPDTGGREALVSPAIPGSRGVSVASMAKESALRSARPVSGASTPGAREEDVVMSLDTPSESPAAVGGGGLMMPLTIDPGGECMPTELEKKRAKLEKYKYECSEVRAVCRAGVVLVRNFGRWATGFSLPFVTVAGASLHLFVFRNICMNGERAGTLCEKKIEVCGVRKVESSRTRS